MNVGSRVTGPRVATAAVASLALLLAGCGDDADSGGGSDGPIRLGAIMTLSGTAQSFGPLGIDQTLEAYFEDVNADGGINGRDVEFDVVDDAATPQGAAQAARGLVDDGTVAFVGGASFVSCTSNAGYYEQTGIFAIEALGVAPECVTAENIATVAPGPVVVERLLFEYAVEELGVTRPCTLRQASPVVGSIQAAAEEASEETGVDIAYADWNIPSTQSDYTPLLLQAKDAGCESISIGGGPQEAPAVAEQMQAQGMNDVILLQSSGSYNEQIGQALAQYDIPMYAASEFETFDSDSPGMQDYMAFITEHDLPQSAFTEAAYVAAETVVQVLEGMDGDITAETVVEALKSADPIESDLTGEPFEAADANESIKVVKLENGVWTTVTPEFLVGE